MQTTNPVSQILLPTGNQALLTAGQRETALAVGQLGIFNYHTGLSVDGTVLGDAHEVYFAVGLNLTGAGGGATLEDIARSAGQVIQKRNVKAITAKAYVAQLPKIVEVAAFTAKCETDYILKVEFRNQKKYMTMGTSQFTKDFSFFTGCCIETDCSSCPQGDCNELAVGLRDAVNADTEALLTASLFVNVIQSTIGDPTTDGTAVIAVGAESFSVPVLAADTPTLAAAKIAAFINSVTTSGYKATSSVAVLKVYPKSSKTANAATISLTSAGGTGITIGTITSANVDVTDTAGFIASVPGACMAIRLTVSADITPAFTGGIPLKYYNPRGTDIIVSLVEGFNCNGVVTTVQELQYEEGAAEEVNAALYLDGGWNGKPGPYRTSAVTGLQRGSYPPQVALATKYSKFVFSYRQDSIGGAEAYFSDLETELAIPCADTTTIQGFFTIADLVFTQFGAMTGDVAGFDCTNVATNLVNNPALDGIESLSY